MNRSADTPQTMGKKYTLLCNEGEGFPPTQNITLIQVITIYVVIKQLIKTTSRQIKGRKKRSLFLETKIQICDHYV